MRHQPESETGGGVSGFRVPVLAFTLVALLGAFAASAAEYATEFFEGTDVDLGGQSFTFTPDASGGNYAVCRSLAAAFPAAVDAAAQIVLGDDDFEEIVLLDGATVGYFGQSYTSVFVGSNGYLTFGSGDWGYFESLEAHFDFPPRISALFDDLNPTAGGSVFFEQAADRIAVTFQDVPEYSVGGANSFQVELFFSGTIRITYLGLSTLDGLAGLSAGQGLPDDFQESDFSGLPMGCDDLAISPQAPFDSYGLVGGPFGPSAKVYTLSNAGTQPLDWNAGTISPVTWMSVVPTGGTLNPSESVVIAVALTGEADTLPASAVPYSTLIAITNATSARTSFLEAGLEIRNPPGDLLIRDNVIPRYDRRLSFRDVAVGSTGGVPNSALGVISLKNLGPGALTIARIGLMRYFESFSDGLASGWTPDVGDNWAAANSMFRARNTSTDPDFMTAVESTEWNEDIAVEVTTVQQGNDSHPHGIAIAASEGFDAGEFDGTLHATGSGYVFLIASNGAFSAWKFENGSQIPLKAWSYSAAIESVANDLRVTAVAEPDGGVRFRFAINGTQAWSGEDLEPLPNGRIALIGYSEGNSTIYRFDNILVSPPGAEDGVSASTPAFGLPADSLPDLPLTIEAQAEASFDVLFQPDHEGDFRDVLVILSDDADDPDAQVSLEGAGESVIEIVHDPLPDTVDLGPYSAIAAITAGAGLLESELWLYYRVVSGGPFARLPLSVLESGSYFAEIPAQALGTQVEYYISASDVMGHVLTDPFRVPDRLHSFIVGLPSLVVTVLAPTLDVELASGDSQTIPASVRLDNVGYGDLIWSVGETVRSLAGTIQSASLQPFAVRPGTEDIATKGVQQPASGSHSGVESIGGPDEGGYTYTDSIEPGGPSVGQYWVEISETGTNLGMTDDVYAFPIPLDFIFDFYGTAYTEVAVGSNGLIYFEDTYLGYGNSCIPGMNYYGVNRFIALYWDDLYPSGTNNVYWQVTGDAPNRKFVVQWHHVAHFGAGGDLTAQVQLFESGGKIVLLYQNAAPTFGQNATAGIQGDPETGLQYRCDAPNLEGGLAVLFQRGVGWLDEVPTSGRIPAGGSSTIDLVFDAAGLPPGYEEGARLVFSSNDADTAVPDFADASLRVAQAVRIDHDPLGDTGDTAGPYPVCANITAVEGVDTSALWAYYRVNGDGAFLPAPMSNTGGDNFCGSIPGQPIGTEVEYYLVAQDMLGGVTRHPPQAPSLVHAFHVVDASGQIEVIDPVEPSNDLFLPFSPPALEIGASAVRTVTIRNAGLAALTITGILDSFLYRESFDDGLAQGWVEAVDAQWNAVDGEYRALTDQPGVWMQSTYAAATWEDLSASVVMRRAGDTGNVSALAVRTSPDFDLGSYSGSAYAVGIDGSGNFWVIRFSPGAYAWLQSWTFSPYLNTGESANEVTLSVEGPAIGVYFNGNLAWMGFDLGLAGPGGIALDGYSGYGLATTHVYDDFEVGQPLPAPAGLNAAQQWYNGHANEAGSPELAPPNDFVPPYPGGDPGALADATEVPETLPDVFELQAVPELPLLLAPDASVTFDVAFNPVETGEFSGAVVIESDDPVSPEVILVLTGMASEALALAHVPLPDTTNALGPYPVEALVTSLYGVASATLRWSIDAGQNFTEVEMVEGQAGVHSGNIPGQDSGTTVLYSIEVVDSLDASVADPVGGGTHQFQVTGIPNLTLSPSNLEFELPHGETETREITLQNTGNWPATWSLRELFAPNLKALGVNAPQGGPGAAPLAGANRPKPPGGGPAVDWRTAHVPGRLLVKFAPTKSGLSAKASVHAFAGGRPIHSFRSIPLDVVQIPRGANLAAMAAAYRARPEVEYAEPDYIVQADVFPDDPAFAQQWALHNTGQTGGLEDADIDAPEAWDTQTGSATVVVAVIDTGIDYTHPDLAANMWINEAEANGTPGLDDDGNGIADDLHGARWTDGTGAPTSGDPMDGNGHGTHVAGTIGAVGNNGTGPAGVAWDVRLMGLKFLTDSGSGSISDAVSALEYAIEMGAHVSSNSWGGGGFSQAMADMIDAARAANQLFIAAAGNESQDNDANPHYPSSYELDNILSVASSDQADAMSWFSNHGATSVDLAAPGSDIYSTWPGGGFNTISGTSMATPHVAGVAALLLGSAPDTPYSDLKAWLLSSADVLPAWSGLTLSGARLNASAALGNSGKPWIDEDPIEGTLASGESKTIAVTVDTTRLENGFSDTAILSIAGDPDGAIEAGVSLNVAGYVAFDHDPLVDTTASGDYEVCAMITALSGSIVRTELFWSVDGGAFTAIPMTGSGGGNLDCAAIPAQAVGSDVCYYIEAEDDQGHVQRRPFEGAVAPICFQVQGIPNLEVALPEPGGLDFFLNPGAAESRGIVITNSGTWPVDWSLGLPGAGVLTTTIVDLPAISAIPRAGISGVLPEGWASSGRPSSREAVRSLIRADATPVDLLILSPNSVPSTLQAGLEAFEDIGALDYFDAAISPPIPADLAPYGVVIVANGFYWADAEATGNVLASYVDSGGKVIVAEAGFDGFWGYGLQGRFADESYGPFVGGLIDQSIQRTLGAHDADHPIMAGVESLADSVVTLVDLQPGAQWVAEWGDGVPLVAVMDFSSVVGINMFPFDYGNISGDYISLFHNAVVWLADGGTSNGWMSMGSASGRLDPGASVEVLITADATGLHDGFHACRGLELSGDPDGVLDVTACLTVYNGALFLGHSPLEDTSNEGPYPVETTIVSASGVSRADLYWSTDGGAVFATTPMIPISGDSYGASIPDQPVGTIIDYYLEAEDGIGNIAAEPDTAPALLHRFEVVSTPPDIFVTDSVVPADDGIVSFDPPIPIGSSSVESITVENLGEQPLTLSGASVAYRVSDNNSPQGPAFDWIEIGVSGTNLALIDDSYSYPISLPFGFEFYGNEYTDIAVGSNGAVYFEDKYFAFANSCIPGSGAVDVSRFIALYWDDLSPSGIDNVYYQIVGEAPSRRLVVEWSNVPHVCCGGSLTAQVQLFESTGHILYLYSETDPGEGEGATAGIQDSPSQGLQYSCDDSVLAPGLAVLFQPERYFALENLPDFPAVLDQFDSLSFDVRFQSPDIGNFLGAVSIRSDDPDAPEVQVDVAGSAVDVIVIGHNPLGDTSLAGPYSVEATIAAPHGLVRADLLWSVDGGNSFTSTLLSIVSGDLYEASVPGQPVDTVVDYYIEAEDSMGSVRREPADAPFATHRFSVVPPSGDIAVSDTALPADDRWIPYSPPIVGPGDSVLHTITVDNAGLGNLVITSIRAGLYYVENFEDGLPQGWTESVDSHWTVTGGEYRAQAGFPGVSMQSRYDAASWDNLSARALIRRTGNSSNVSVLAVRTSPDFDYATFAGSAYATGINVDGTYWVIRFSPGGFSWLQSWTFSPYLNTGEATNDVMFSIDGDAINVYFNGNLAWSGFDSGHGEAGGIALVGYSGSLFEIAHFYDDVEVGLPVPPVEGLSAAQAWYNNRPLEGGTPAEAPPGAAIAEFPGTAGGPIVGDALSAESVMPAFVTEGLPSLPAVLGPGQSFAFEVRFQPEAQGEFTETLFINSDDPDTPALEVGLTGTAGDLFGIEHGPLGDTINDGPYVLGATITAANGIARADTIWTADGGATFSSVSMANVSGDHYVAAIPGGHPDGTVIGYYIEVEDAVGNIDTGPGGAPVELYEFTIEAPPGDLAVFDSVDPVDDRLLPFSPPTVTVGSSVVETITVLNDGLGPLTIGSVLGGLFYAENFNDDLAQGWVETVDAQWNVSGGAYAAREDVLSTWMQASYDTAPWENFSASVRMSRTATASNTSAFAVRTSPDFDIQTSTGSAYATGILGDGTFWVIRFSPGGYAWLQSWTFSAYLNTGEAVNDVAMSVSGDAIAVYFNGHLAWSGSDSGIPDAGGIALMAYNNPEGIYLYDDIEVGLPIPSADGLSEAQAWYNSHPLEGGSPWEAPAESMVAAFPGELGDPMASDNRTSGGELGLESVGYSALFNSGTDGFTADPVMGGGLWHQTAGCEAASGDHSTPGALYYGVDGACNYDAGITAGAVVSPPIALPGDATATLTFAYFLETERAPSYFDMASVEVSSDGGVTYTLVAHNDANAGAALIEETEGAWRQLTVNLAAFAGDEIVIRVGFATVDSGANTYRGFYIDDLSVDLDSTQPFEFEGLPALPAVLAPGESFVFDVRFQPIVDGPFTGVVHIESDDPETPSARVDLSGMAQFAIVIDHTPLGAAAADGPYAVDAAILSQAALVRSEVFWSTDGGANYASVPMAIVSGDLYQALIPGQPVGTQIKYYIEVEDSLGLVIAHPAAAPGETHQFDIVIYPGDIEVTDSVEPPDDFSAPFSAVNIGASATETMTIRNNGLGPLSIENISEAAAPGMNSAPDSVGGPDAGGYTFIDNYEPGGPAFDWIDVTGTGTNLNLVDESSSPPIAIPFAFEFYGSAYDAFVVADNGAIYFEGGYFGYANACLPDGGVSGIGAFIAPYWADLYPGGTNNVYYQVVGDAPNRRLVIEWYNVYSVIGGETVTAQVQLFENGGDILFLYEDAYPVYGGYAAAGIQGDAVTGISYSCQQGDLYPGLAVLFEPGDAPGEGEGEGPSAFFIEGLPEFPATLAPGDSLSFSLRFEPIVAGEYSGTVSIESDDPSSPVIETNLTASGFEAFGVAHDPLEGAYDFAPYAICLELSAFEGLNPAELWLYYSIDGGVTYAGPLPLILSGEGVYCADIPAQLAGATVHYYAVLRDALGRVGTFPLGSPWSFEVAGTPDFEADHPDEIVFVLNPGASQTQTITVGNTGPQATAAGEWHIASDVLLAYAGGPKPDELRRQLEAFPEVARVEAFDASRSTPTLDELEDFNVVIVLSADSFADPLAMGDVLALYAAGGGKIIQTLATFESSAAWELGGAFARDYSPFTSGEFQFRYMQLGDYDLAHPIMASIGFIEAEFAVGVGLAEDAEPVADWDDGTPAIATRGGNVVAMNVLPFAQGEWQADANVQQLLRNAIEWLNRQWLSVFPVSGNLEIGSETVVSLTASAEGFSDGDETTTTLVIAGDPHPDGNIERTVRLIVDEYLSIVHEPLENTPDAAGPYLVDATITAENGVNESKLKLYYSVNRGPIEEVALQPLGLGAYRGEIPGQPFGTLIEYYLSAQNAIGQLLTNPIEAPDDRHAFRVFDPSSNLFAATFETGGDGFVFDNGAGTGGGLWHHTTACQAVGAEGALYYGIDASCSYDAGNTQGFAVSPPVVLPPPGQSATLTFSYFLETEGLPSSYDRASVEVSTDGGASWGLVAHNYAGAAAGLVLLQDPTASWRRATVNLSAFAGSEIMLRLGFATGDSIANGHKGFYVDDLSIDLAPDCEVPANPSPADAEANVAVNVTLAWDQAKALAEYLAALRAGETGVESLVRGSDETPLFPPVPSETPPVVVPDALASVAIFQNLAPWGTASNQVVLTANGISHQIFGSADMGYVDLAGFDKVIVSSVQDAQFYAALAANRDWFEDYVISGGLLDLHLASYTSAPADGLELPGGFVTQSLLSSSVSIADPFHPIVTVPHAISHAELQGWNYSTHGIFSSAPLDAVPIVNETGSGLPCAMELALGAGRILATLQTVEWIGSSPNYFENMTLHELGGCAPSYDVYFGTDPNSLARVYTGLEQPYCDFPSLSPGTVYFWQVDAIRCCGATLGPVWSFTTGTGQLSVDAFEADDSPQSASPIALNGVPQERTLDRPGDVDWAIFFAAAGQAIHVDATASAPGAQLFVQLYRLEGIALVAESVPLGNRDVSASIEWTADASGGYLVRVATATPAATGASAAYRLDVWVESIIPSTLIVRAVDEATGEPIDGVEIIIDDLANGYFTNEDGLFTLPMEPGPHTVCANGGAVGFTATCESPANVDVSDSEQEVVQFELDPDAKLEVTPAGLNFGRVYLGSTVERLVTVTNVGTGTRVITGDALWNALGPIRIMDGSHYVLDPGQSSQVIVEFAPLAPAITQGTMEFTTGVRGSETIVVSGTGRENAAPVLAGIGPKAFTENQAGSFTVTASDVDGDTLTYGVSNAPEGAVFDPGTRTFSWTPDFDNAAAYPGVTFTVTDDRAPFRSDTETITITVQNTNRPPVLNSIGDQAFTEGQFDRFTVTATDPDGDDLTYTAIGLPSGAALDSVTGECSWSPGFESLRSYSGVQFIVTDDGLPVPLQASGPITITVANTNRVPFLDSVEDQSVAEGETLSFTVTASDFDGGTPVLSVSNLPGGATFDPATGNFAWTPGTTDAGPYEVTFIATDGEGLAGTMSVTITVTNVNRAPSLDPIDNQSIAEGELLTFTLSATDPDDDTLTFGATDLPGDATLNATTGVFVWTPGYEDASEYPVEFTVSDGAAPPVAGAVVITVSNTNRAPALSPIGSRAAGEGETLTIVLSAFDPDGDAIAYAAFGLPEGAQFDPGTATFTWTPGFGESGNYGVEFAVTDNGTPVLSASEAITISVGDVNRPPALEAVGDRQALEGERLALTLTSVDLDAEDTMTYLMTNAPTGAELDPVTGSFGWTPGFDDAGVYTGVVFTVADDGTPIESDFESITITIINSNRAPELAEVADREVAEGAPLEIALGASDPDSGDARTFAMSNTPPGASLNPITGVFAWTPGFDDAGRYDVAFTVTDDGTPAPLDDAELVTITVTNTNRPPTLAAIADSEILVGQRLEIALDAVDPDSTDRLTFGVTGLPPGEGSIDPITGVFAWTPSATGTYEAMFTVTDDGTPGPLQASETATIAVSALPVAAFSADVRLGTAPLTVQFTDESVSGSAEITSWNWNFGDDTFSEEQHPGHDYASDGVYTVSLTVTTATGTDAEIKTGYITVTGDPASPTAAFSADVLFGPAPLTVRFSDESAPGTAPITAWAWNFGDSGPIGADPDPEHVFALEGVYSVSLTVTTAGGIDLEIKTAYITVGNDPVPPVADFNADARFGPAPLSVQFVDESRPGSTGITEWLWNFGDAATSTQPNPRHVYESDGVYTVSLTVTTGVDDNTATRTGFITVSSLPVPPTAAFSANPTSGTAPLAVEFADESGPGSESITGWEWDFGDGTSSNLQNPAHVYEVAGVYPVSLAVTTSVDEDTEVKNGFITVRSAAGPAADFSASLTSGPAPLTVQFTDESAEGNAEIASWAWTFGDTGTSAEPNPGHVYDAEGVYTVSLTVTTPLGTDTETKFGFIEVLGSGGELCDVYLQIHEQYDAFRSHFGIVDDDLDDDGLPDEALLDLLQGLLCPDLTKATVADAALRAAFDTNLAELIARNDPAVAEYRELLALLLAVSAESRDAVIAELAADGVTLAASGFDTLTGEDALYDGGADLDGDGVSNADEYDLFEATCDICSIEDLVDAVNNPLNVGAELSICESLGEVETQYAAFVAAFAASIDRNDDIDNDLLPDAHALALVEFTCGLVDCGLSGDLRLAYAGNLAALDGENPAAVTALEPYRNVLAALMTLGDATVQAVKDIVATQASLTGAYTAVEGATVGCIANAGAGVSELYSAAGDFDGDGFTNLDEYDNVAARAGTTIADFVEAATDPGSDGSADNHVPSLNAVGDQQVKEKQPLTFVISGGDPDAGDSLTYSATNLPPGASFDPATRTFAWTPAAGDAGTYPGVVFKVADHAGLSDSESIAILVTPGGCGSAADGHGGAPAPQGDLELSLTIAAFLYASRRRGGSGAHRESDVAPR